MGIRSAQAGLLTNAGLAIVKILAGVLGHSYALIADGVESVTDVFSSVILWRGLTLAARSPDEDYPFGYGKAETLSAAPRSNAPGIRKTIWAGRRRRPT